MNFDDILRLLGQFGLYQKQQFLMLSMVVFSCGVQIMMTVFTLATPRHRCALPGVSNDSFVVVDEHHSVLTDILIPRDLDIDGTPQHSQCYIYTSSNASDVMSNVTVDDISIRHEDNITDQNRSAEQSLCSRWVFDTMDFDSTITTQMGFVCGNEILRSHAVMAIMFGQMIGCIVLGPISDLIGRKKMLMISLIFHLGASIAISWATNVYMLCAVYLINGTVMAAAYCTSYTLAMELIGPSWRHVTAIAMTGFWSLGMLWVCLLAYFIRDWHNLQLAASCPIVLFFVYFYTLPESARWLIRKGRYSEAKTIIIRAAEINKVSLPEDLQIKNSLLEESGDSHESIFTLLKHPKLLLRAGIIFFNWMVCSLSYYGLGLNVGQLSGSIYMNFCFSALFEISAYVVIILAMSRLGRKTLFCWSILLGGTACLLTILPVLFASQSELWTVRVLAMVGKFGMSGAFAIAWMYTCELFPTSMRASIAGISSFCARLGGVFASYIGNLTQSVPGVFGPVMPQIIFGFLGVVSGSLVPLLPETFGRQLPECTQDAIRLSQKPRKRPWITHENGDCSLQTTPMNM